jgi:hypothetical protein
MKIKTIIAFVAIAGALELVGCKPKQVTLTGQIFIVTRGAENVKLGLVEVQLIPKQQVYAFLDSKYTAIEAEISSRQHDLATSKDLLENAVAIDTCISNVLISGVLEATYETPRHSE